MRYALSLILLLAYFLGSSAFASRVDTWALILCDETGNAPVKVRVVLTRAANNRSHTMILSQPGRDEDGVILAEGSVGEAETVETPFVTTYTVPGQFEWSWSRRPGDAGYRGKITILRDVKGWPAKSRTVNTDCGMDVPFGYEL